MKIPTYLFKTSEEYRESEYLSLRKRRAAGGEVVRFYWKDPDDGNFYCLYDGDGDYDDEVYEIIKRTPQEIMPTLSEGMLKKITEFNDRKKQEG